MATKQEVAKAIVGYVEAFKITCPDLRCQDRGMGTEFVATKPWKRISAALCEQHIDQGGRQRPVHRVGPTIETHHSSCTFAEIVELRRRREPITAQRYELFGVHLPIVCFGPRTCPNPTGNSIGGNQKSH